MPKPSTLTYDVVAQARRRARNGFTIAELARSYSVEYSTILAAVRGRTWTQVDTVEPPVPATRTSEAQDDYHGGRRLLTADQVAAARRDVLQGVPVRVLAERCEVKRQVMYAAIRGTTWSDMIDPAPVPYLTGAPTTSGHE